MKCRFWLIVGAFLMGLSTWVGGQTRELAEEVRDKGWIVFCARAETGDWDLFLCRPDGSDLRNITRTPDYNEASPQFSRDGRRLLYRRLPRERDDQQQPLRQAGTTRLRQ